ncbi:MAG: hypothetical protein F6K24_18285 [Okeania sp. SIO2D1]|nr:hypothetical protein [Okeania sp. SIO2D1]
MSWAQNSQNSPTDPQTAIIKNCKIGSQMYDHSYKLQWDNLQALCERNITVTHIPNFYPKHLCEYHPQMLLVNFLLYLAAELILKIWESWIDRTYPRGTKK